MAGKRMILVFGLVIFNFLLLIWACDEDTCENCAALYKNDTPEEARTAGTWIAGYRVVKSEPQPEDPDIHKIRFWADIVKFVKRDGTIAQQDTQIIWTRSPDTLYQNVEFTTRTSKQMAYPHSSIHPREVEGQDTIEVSVYKDAMMDLGKFVYVADKER